MAEYMIENSNKNKKLYLFGIASTYTFECIEIAERAGIQIKGFIHNQDNTDFPAGLSPLYRMDQIDECDKTIPVAIPLITPGYRKQIETDILNRGFKLLPELIHPSAIIAKSVFWETGFNVNAGVVIGTNSTAGKQVLVNRSVSIGHDAFIEDYVSFGPGCVLGGHVKVSKGAFIGINATILPKVTIGANSIVGGGAVVTKDVPDNVIVTGNPARVVKTGIAGYNLKKN